MKKIMEGIVDAFVCVYGCVICSCVWINVWGGVKCKFFSFLIMSSLLVRLTKANRCYAGDELAFGQCD